MDLLGQYAAGPTIIVGLLTTLGLYGLGSGIWRATGCSPSRLHGPLAHLLTGTLAYLYAIELLALVGLSSRLNLMALWGGSILAGMSFALIKARVALRHRTPWRVPLNGSFRLSWLALIIVSLSALGIASSLPTQLDGLHYHLLYSRRLIEDGGLLHYHFPIHAAVPTQMLFQSGAAPLWALGQPGAWQWLNVASWWCALILIWRWARAMGWCVSNTSVLVAAAGSSLLLVVWYAQAGAHGFGDAAGVGAMTLLLSDVRKRRSEDHALFGLYLLAMTGAKLSTGPIALIFLLGYITQQVLGHHDSRGCWRSIVWACLPALLVHGPMLVFAFVETGSPLGPYLTETLGSPYYAKPGLETNLEGTIANNRYGWNIVALFFGVFIQPVVWLALCVSAVRAIGCQGYGTIMLALLTQLTLMAWVLPQDTRFLSGLQYAGLVMLPLSFPLLERPHLPGYARVLLVSSVLLWSIPPLVFAADFDSDVVGSQGQHARIAETVPEAPAIRALTGAVSEETWIIAPRGMAGKKLSLAVSSRPIVMVPDDIPQDVTSIALLWLGPQRPKPIERMLSPFGTVKLGESIGEPIEVSWPDGSGGAEHQSLGLYTLERTP